MTSKHSSTGFRIRQRAEPVGPGLYSSNGLAAGPSVRPPEEV